jgi:hypothetical protein
MRMRFAGGRFIVFGILWAGGMGLVTVLLWNALMPALAGLHQINFFQALGLLLLIRLLFGGLPGRGMGRRRPRFVRGWKDLNADERHRFSEAMGHRPNEYL